jgi:hypothetical protein
VERSEEGREADGLVAQDVDLTRIDGRAALELASQLRALGRQAGSIEEVGSRVTRFLYDHLRAVGGQRSCVLARFFETHPFGKLPGDLQACARVGAAGHPLAPAMRCLILFGTTGDRAEWCSPSRSAHHRAIPVASAALVDQSPMISRLLHELGLPVPELRAPAGGLLGREEHTCNVFYVPQASGSPYVPAQDDFVIPCGIQSVLGFGGWLPTGELFATVLFTRVPVPPATVDLWKQVAVGLRQALIPWLERAWR